MSLSLGKLHMGRRKAWVLTVFILLCYHMLLPTNFDFLNVLRDSFYLCIVPVLVAAVLYFRGFRDNTEYKLLFAFWIWFWFSRALNGSPTMDHDFEIFFDLSLMLPFFALGQALTKTEKESFLDWLSAVIGGFYFVIGLIALLSFLRRSAYYLPIAKTPIGIVPESGYGRIIILNDNANITAFWYLIALFLMIYQFFHCEKKLWRVPILLSAVLDLLVISITRSRSIWFCTALVLAMLTAMLLRQALQSKPRFLRSSVVFVAAALVLIASYEASALCADVMDTLSYKATEIQSAPTKTMQKGENPNKTRWTENRISLRPTVLSSGRTEKPEAVRLVSDPDQSNPSTRTEDSNGVSFSRRQIWRGAFQTIETMPSILWKGHICDSVIIEAYRFITTEESEQIPWNFYNSLIQVLMITGLPGLFLVIAFLALVLYRGIRFSLCFGAPFAIRTLVLPVVTTMPYFMLEAGLFSAIDVRTLFYFLICGFMLGFVGDLQN